MVVAVQWSVVAGPTGGLQPRRPTRRLFHPAGPHRGFQAAAHNGAFHPAGLHRGFHPAAHTEASTPRPARRPIFTGHWRRINLTTAAYKNVSRETF